MINNIIIYYTVWLVVWLWAYLKYHSLSCACIAGSNPFNWLLMFLVKRVGLTQYLCFLLSALAF